MKYVFEKETTDDAIDTVAELEYKDLLPIIKKASFSSTKDVTPRSFARLQHRARKCVAELLLNSKCNVMVLCGSAGLDNIEIAKDLLKDAGCKSVNVVLAPTKAECFGDDKQVGIFKKPGVVIMPITHLLDHPKYIGILQSCLYEIHGIKLLLCGDATDCAAINILWPRLEDGLRTDLVMEFSISAGLKLMAGLVASYRDKYSLKDFDVSAIELLCVYTTRISGDRRYLGILEERLIALVIAANNYAEGALVQRKDVKKAICAEDFRVNYLCEAELRNHRDRQILLSTKGEVTGQINGLSVIETAGTSYEYGEPVRITATLRAGGEGDIIDIERKAELAGQIHAKAMMIINGFISDEFGSQQPMPVSASLVFEQSYSEIDGDSASLTGLCAVISALSELPVRQDLAVTGAVDQFGDVQPVGGVNEKIEGFYRICRLNGLTGTQGVIIPYSCINQLVLRPSVINAVKNGKFHIYVVSHVTGAARLLMNTRWGEEDDDKSICGLVCSRLDELSAVKSVKPWWHLW
ncbi:MAG: S16 family serine protease [Succinivibrio sp.]